MIFCQKISKQEIIDCLLFLPTIFISIKLQSLAKFSHKLHFLQNIAKKYYWKSIDKVANSF